ncbi:exodeoxyribonuclease V subunit alpha [Pseudokineococcus lusitanus]|uniref:RecBCD enzyme subunit RecD n=1 Tax=Pseudokineococcus lusitanus TaxID=763993 RepID=A0A3N1HQK7_9ACTN|nr:exodeoxyribonuclease V subunit alpha [Pseudokineococcus lusitanus]ROP44771.1 DNA helicase/exodeoxyribonuclease V alpha subunit [Pseudokineococcus lusitanus]
MTGDPRAGDVALRATGLLRDFNRAGLLQAADVHVAQRLGVLGGEDDEAVLLAAALVVRSTRQGSVVVDLRTAQETTAADDVDEDDAPDAGAGTDVPDDGPAWPGADWAARVAASPLAGGPLRVEGSRVWLGRYRDQEELVARELAARAADVPDDLDPAVLGRALDRLFAPQDADQREAAAGCALARVSVLAGGPGTGKTTTVSKVVALLREQHPTWRVALAAPTGRAAARLAEAVRDSTARLPEEDRERLGELPATTLHRLLGWRPGARHRFRHDRSDRLALEVLVVDESSMVSLTLMARLLEALRPQTRLVLVGDPDQLASVEAGTVLGDLVDADAGPQDRHPRLADALARAGALPVGQTSGRPDAAHRPVTVRDGVGVLRTTRRFGGVVGSLAAAVREGRGEEALAVLTAGEPGATLVLTTADAVPESALDAVRDDVVASATALGAAARAGDGGAALAALDRHRLLTAHRAGPRGLRRWGELAERWTRAAEVAAGLPRVRRADGHHVGEPLIVTVNDPATGLANGDVAVLVDDGEGGLAAAVGVGGAPRLLPLGRLPSTRPLHAMTVHRSQGSQFDAVTLVLPPAGSPLLTRETLYTALTRARERVRVVGDAEALLAAVARPAARASGLRERLRGG